MLTAVAVVTLLGVSVGPAAADTIPSGERIQGQSVLEPVYNDDEAGQIGFIKTPLHAPLNANPRAWAPFFVPVYPVGATVGTLLCQTTPVENCPDHGPGIAAAARAAVPSVYGAGVLGHDHLISFPGGADFNVAWEPILVLFTSAAAANEHLLTAQQIDAAVRRGDAFKIPLPPLTFHCEVVAARVYELGTPV
jgi:hypothetical protein